MAKDSAGGREKVRLIPMNSQVRNTLFGLCRDQLRGTMQVVVVRVESGAEGGSRTRTSFRTMDFKSTASAIPPPRHLSVKSRVP